MEEEWDYLCSELGILEDEKKKKLIRRFVKRKENEDIEYGMSLLRNLLLLRMQVHGHDLISRAFIEGVDIKTLSASTFKVSTLKTE